MGWPPEFGLSPKIYNAKTGFAVMVPITNRAKGYSFAVQLPAQMKTTGVVLADAIEHVDWRAHNAKYSDRVPIEVIKVVRPRLVALLGLAEP
jgi:mRNA interferase MazF